MSTESRLIGEIEGFTTEPFLRAAEILVQADEPERALALLDNLPARYRDIVPPDVQQLRTEILGALATPHAYMTLDQDAAVDAEASVQLLNGLLRGQRVKELVADLNAKELAPHIVEMGPGEYWLPLGLEKLGYHFTYCDVSLLQRTAKQAREYLPEVLFNLPPAPGTPVIFVAFELIEHLADPRELAVEAVRHCGRMPDYVFLSTPHYTFDGSKKDWRKPCGQPHLRAYTPQEFFDTARTVFPGYTWEIEADQVVVMKGKRNV